MIRFFGSLLGTLALLLFELVMTILVYTGLNIYSLELFGKLVRVAAAVLETISAFVGRIFAGSADTAYASLFGELGPKSMLLLLIGLAVAAVMRLLVGGVRAMVSA